MGHKEANAKWYATHKEAAKAKSRQWKQEHKTETLAYMQAWHLAHPEESVRQYKIRKEKHPSRVNWANMMGRCYDVNHPSYYLYGGKNISVDPKWHDFTVYESEFGYLKPGPGFTVDRLDNNQGYRLSNVRWATRKEQVINRRGRGPNRGS